MKELCKLEIDRGYDFATSKDKGLSEDQKKLAEILMKNGYPCEMERFLPEGTNFWKVRLVVYDTGRR